MQLATGTKLSGRYRIIEPIARSPLATVHLASDESNGEIVTVKVLPREVDARGEFDKSFRREAKILNELYEDIAQAQIKNKKRTTPPIVRVIDFGVTDTYLFIVMEHVPGKTVAQLLSEKGRLDEAEALAITQQVAEILLFTSERGLVHRDIKPSNIMRRPDGTVRLLDFGLAVYVTKITPSQPLGALAYLAPEQIQPPGKGNVPAVDIRADIYSLGATLHEMLTGQPPFSGTNFLQLANAITSDDPVPVSKYREDISISTEELVARCLKKNPADRFPSPSELITAVKTVLSKAMTGASATFQRAKQSFQTGDWQNAIKLANQAGKADASYLQAADELIAKAKRRQDELENKQISNWLDLANAAAKQENWEQVRNYCSQILALQSGHEEARRLLAKLPKADSGQLVLTSESGRKYLPKRGRNLIGRYEPGQKVVPDIDLKPEKGGGTVSRKHAELILEGSDWLLVVLPKTTNPTRLNDELVAPESKRKLKKGDRISIAAVTLTVDYQSDS